MRHISSAILVVVLLASSSQAELIFHLPLDDGQLDPNTTTAVDISPNGHNGTLQGFASPPAWTTGIAGGALDFPTGGDQVRISSVGAATPLGADPRTAAMWINPDGYGDRKFFSYGGGGAGNSFDFVVENGGAGPAVRFRHGGGNMFYPFGFDPIGEWTHVAMVVPDGAAQVQDLELYINGALTPFDVGTANNPTAAFGTPLSDIIIGRRFNGGTQFNGQVDDVQFYDNALTADEVASLFNNPGLSLPQLQAIPEPTSIALWTLIGLGLGGFGYYRSRKKK